MTKPLRKNLGRVCVASALLTVVASQQVTTQSAPANAGLTAIVGIAARVNRQNAVEEQGGSVTDTLSVGESTHLGVAVGRGDELCHSSIWASKSDDFPARMANEQAASAQYVWRFDVRMLEVMTERITFELSWVRTSRLAPGEVLRKTQQLTMREGESRAIDLLHGRQDGDCDSVVIEVGAGITEDRALAGKTLEWDLWLDGGAHVDPAHRGLTSAQGDSAAFKFEPMPTSQVFGGGATAFAQVYGQLRGRVRSDGNIDVALNTNRVVSVDPSSSPTGLRPTGNATRSGSGQKNFALKPGETVKIVLPKIASSAPSDMSITVRARVR